MMTQADILSKNEDGFSDYTSPVNQSAKPSNFDSAFPDLVGSQLNEQSPIRPIKYFANDSALNASKGLRKIIMGGSVFTFVVTLALILQIAFGGTQVPNRIGIVTQESVCSEIGADMVRMGGNSVDAYIASSLCLSVVNPFSAGLGAGGFLLVRDHKHERDYSYNCFFKSTKLTRDIQTSPEGIKSIAVPGELKCLQSVYHRHARFYWKTLSTPAIKLAREGFKVSKSLANALELIKNEINTNSYLKEMYLDSNDQLVKEGSIIQNKIYADTLETLIRTENSFYVNGDLGKELVDELTTDKRQITPDDLNSYKAEENNFIKIKFDDFMILTPSFPSSGPILKFIIDLIKSFSFDKETIKSADFYSRLLEASKLGYNLASLAPFDLTQSDSSLYDKLFNLAKNYLHNMNTTEYPFQNQNGLINDDFMVNFISVNDHNDLMVSYVGTLGSAWGSKVFIKSGYFMNNGLNLFTYDAKTGGNLFAEDKQPRGLMAPIITYNTKNPCIRRFAISYKHQTMNSDDFAFSELAQVISNILTDISLYENVLSDKRVQYIPGQAESEVCLEVGFDSSILEKLEAETNFKPTNSCSFHAIDLVMKKDHVIFGQADPRPTPKDSLVVFN